MITVNNRKVISKLSKKSLLASRARNIVAVLAIVLTTVLFTALFTIMGTILSTFEQQNFRQAGGDFHGAFKDVSEEQIETLTKDSAIKGYGLRLMLGMPSEPPFHKTHVEISYMDENCAKGSFCTPEHGRLPKEGSNEIACDTAVLQLLGVEPQKGAEIALSYDLDWTDGNKKHVEGTFILSGWWEADGASMSNMALVSRSYAEEVLADYTQPEGDMSGKWDLNVYLKNASHIEEDLKAIAERNGYQTENGDEENFLRFGVNWGYVGAQLSQKADPITIGVVSLVLLVIIFTGYLIIYNIFQISVSNDVRFYGLLKTIGTTPRQIRRIVRRQAVALSVIGIPIGLLLGYLLGVVLAPAVLSALGNMKVAMSLNPLIFIGATLFSLFTVFLSCAKPGRLAGKVSPIEALRYTEGERISKKGKRRGHKGGTIPRMAFVNMGRNKKKTALVILSLAFSVVLMQVSYTFALSMDMDKYLKDRIVTDYILGNSDYFRNYNPYSTIPEEAIAAVEAQGGVTDAGRVYSTNDSTVFVTEENYRTWNEGRFPPELIDETIRSAERNEEGLLEDRVDLYGMEALPLDELTVLEGDLAPVYDPTQRAIAAVYHTDDYGEPQMGTNWANVGDQVSIRYVDEEELYDSRTGETVTTEEMAAVPEEYLDSRAARYHDEVYTVSACVTMRNSMGLRVYGGVQFVLNDDVLRQNVGNLDPMTYLFNTGEEEERAMGEFLANYTEQEDPTLDYESREGYAKEFEGFRNMFLLLGVTLSVVIAVVGILNFLNAVTTSIMTRRREFAMMQSIGMTGKQLKGMLVLEGVFYAAFAIFISLMFSLMLGPLLKESLGNIFWFFSYHFTLMPCAVLAPIFLLLGVLLPMVSYHTLAGQSIVERLRETE